MSRRSLVSLLCALLAVVGAPLSDVSAQVAPAFVLDVFHFNDGESDLLGSTEGDVGAGSIARFGTVLNDLRAASTADGSLTVSAGDQFLAGAELNAGIANPAGILYDAIAHDHLDIDAIALGNHDFDFGPEFLADYMTDVLDGAIGDEVFLSANLDFSGEADLQALVDSGDLAKSATLTVSGEQVGVIGLTTDELPIISSPRNVSVIEPMADQVQAEVTALTGAGVDKILLVSHLQNIDNEVALVAELSGVDAVIGGGGGERLPGHLEASDLEGNTVPVVTAPGDYLDVGSLSLGFDAAGNLVDTTWTLEPVTGAVTPDPFLVDNVETPVADYVAALDENVLATSEVPLNGVRGDVRTRETNVGNLMTDGFVHLANERAADFDLPPVYVGLQNGGGIRNDSIIADGELTELDTFAIAAFENYVAVVPDVSRDDLLAAIEHGLSALPAAAGSFAQWSGLEIVYDPAAPAGDRVLGVTITETADVIVDGGEVVAGAPVAVASINFLFAGGDGYSMFGSPDADPPTLNYQYVNIGLSYQAALAEYATHLGTITAEDYSDPVAAPTRIVPVSTEMPAAVTSAVSNFVHVGTVDVTEANGSAVAEINDISGDGNRVFYTDAENGEIGILDVADPANPTGEGTIAVGGDPTSLAVVGDHVLVAVNTSPSFIDPSGVLKVYGPTNLQVGSFDLDGQPDAVSISPDESYAAIVIENERDEDLDGGFLPQLPSGGLQILDLDGSPSEWDLSTVDFSSMVDGVKHGDDLEPEFVSINGLNQAVVTFQENNHVAVVDVTDGTIVNHFPAGSVALTNVDVEENDELEFGGSYVSRREPDAVTWINDTMFATANEGDYEDPDGVEGGSRGFTIFDVDGDVIYESGGGFERLLASAGHYIEGRTENKGAEPEAVAHGAFGGTPLTFVGAERANAVAVYDTTDPGAPVARQVLPTGMGPEGITTVPDRDLLIVSTESSTDDIPAVVSFYEYGAAPAAYPTIQSAMASTDEVPVPWVALSGLAGDPADASTVYAVSDAFLATGFIYTVDVSGQPAVITDALAVDADGLDLEGIAVGPDGSFWLASEGDADATLNQVLHVDGTGAVLDTIELPAPLEAGARSNGLEGIAVTGDAGAEVVYVAIQRAWPDVGDTDGSQARIGRFDTSTDEWTFVYYPLEAEGAGGWIGLSELTLMPDGTFAVIERDKGWGESTGLVAELKAIYTVDLAAADFRADSDALSTVDKQVLYDALPALEAATVVTPEKLEGMAMTADGLGFVVTDNDGLDDAPGETAFLGIGAVCDNAAGFTAFSDVSVSHPFCAEISWMAQSGVSTGFDDGTFRPAAPVTRQAMAAFLARLAEAALPPCTEAPFPDVSVSHPFCAEISWMAQSGVSTGFDDGTFRPAAPVTRQAMAAFMARLAEAELSDCAEAPFPDVSVDHTFCTAIAWMGQAGISTGFTDGSYRPTIPVTRQAMAAFMQRLDALG